jgi:hypothetical protein
VLLTLFRVSPVGAVVARAGNGTAVFPRAGVSTVFVIPLSAFHCLFYSMPGRWVYADVHTHSASARCCLPPEMVFEPAPA